MVHVGLLKSQVTYFWFLFPPEGREQLVVRTLVYFFFFLVFILDYQIAPLGLLSSCGSQHMDLVATQLVGS